VTTTVRLIDRGRPTPPRDRRALTPEEANELAICRVKWRARRLEDERIQREAEAEGTARLRQRIAREVAILLFLCVAQVTSLHWVALADIAATLLLGWAIWLALGAARDQQARLIPGRKGRA
jgi:hypothetical protein